MSLRYTPDHEWIAADGTVGITAYAQEQLGDVVFVELPEIGRELGKGDQAAVVESVKAASEIFAPVAGRVVAVNEALSGEPGLLNTDPTGKGWIFKLEMANPAEFDTLLDEAAYQGQIG